MRQPKIRFNGASYRVAEIINTGMTSIVYKTSEGPVIKRFRPGKPINGLEREVFWLGRLREIGLVPELLGVDELTRAILMSDCGEPISTRNAPQDWEAQLKSSMEGLRANQCIHGDLSEHEVLVKDGKIHIVDFALACDGDRDIISSMTRSGKKARFFIDDYITDYIRFKLYGSPPEAEPHCFVLWDFSEHWPIQAELSNKFDLLRGIVYMPTVFGKMLPDREQTLAHFYCRRPCSSGKKGLTPFILYFVLDKAPRYEIRTNSSRGTHGLVNVNVFDLKTRLRAGRKNFLHGSDSIQECFDNLESLSYYEENVPKSYWFCWRPVFSSVDEFFGRLSQVEGLEYVVMRNFDSLLEGKLDKGSDIDLLVNDYYMFKRVTGAIGYKHKRSKRPGPAYEYGGYKVSGYVSIAGQETSVDIRYIGDGYYCEQWERAMLSRRVRRDSLFIPDTYNLFYSLLYHTLVHKRAVSDDYRQTISGMAPSVGIDRRVAESDEQLWGCLDAFMIAKHYTYDRPKELSIQLSAAARARMGITTEHDLQLAGELATRGQLLEASDLLRSLPPDGPGRLEARRLLRTYEKNFRGSRPGANLMGLARMKQLARILPETVKRPIRKLISVN